MINHRLDVAGRAVQLFFPPLVRQRKPFRQEETCPRENQPFSKAALEMVEMGKYMHLFYFLSCSLYKIIGSLNKSSKNIAFTSGFPHLNPVRMRLTLSIAQDPRASTLPTSPPQGPL